MIEAEYTSLNIHAPMEPMNALAELRDGQWHIYTGNQFNARTTAIAAACAGVDASKVVHPPATAGRRLESDMVIPAVLAAKEAGRPVKLIYSRKDDMPMDFTRPLTHQHVKLGLDGGGKVIAMEQDVIGARPTLKWGIPAFMAQAVDK